jgi:myo-inositol-1(or 4)-monophosphatase
MQFGKFNVNTKASGSDLVTDIDRHAEQELVTAIRQARPNDSIVGEEGTNHEGTSGVRWVLDPLDGTSNFVHHYPAHSVAVGIEIDGHRVAGVVHDTYSNRVYAGLVGEGATCDGLPITVRHENNLSRALVGTGFLPDADVRRLQVDLLRKVLPCVRDIRRSGCPSLDICNVAAGALDAFYECGLGPWDIAGAAAVAEAAGATVLLLDSKVLPNPFLIVANAQLMPSLLALFAEIGLAEGA